MSDNKYDTDKKARTSDPEATRHSPESSEGGRTRGYKDTSGRGKPSSREESVGHQARHFFPVLICLSGAQRGERRSIRTRRVVIGRGSKCDWQINDSSTSREHVMIEHMNLDEPAEFPNCYISDAGSRNGTRVNGKPLEGRYLLEERDRILIGSTMIGFFIRDEAEFKHDESLYLSATSDPLTRLDNRRQLRLHMKHHIARARRYSAPLTFLLLDLDFFKLINDNYGHDVGDMALVHVADLLRQNLRENDLIARWGGEEFAICLPDCPLDEGVLLAERLRRCVEETPFKTPNGLEVKLTTSIGGTSFTDGDTEDTLFQRADHFLYQAKNEGRNKSVVSTEVVDELHSSADRDQNPTIEESSGHSFED